MELNSTDLQLLLALDERLTSFGYQSSSLDGQSSLNVVSMFRNMDDLMQQHQMYLVKYDDLEDKLHKSEKENEHLNRKIVEMKHNEAQAHKDILSLEHKLCQMQAKLGAQQKVAKDALDENKRIQHMLDQREKQFKHEKKKLESEENKLKQRISSLSSSKDVKFPIIELNEVAKSRFSNNSPSTQAKQSNNKAQLETMYNELLQDYNHKNKELMIELQEVKNFLCQMKNSLDCLHVNENVFEDEDDETTCCDGVSNEEKSNEKPLTDEQIRLLPFELVYQRLNKHVQDKCASIRKAMDERRTDDFTVENETFESQQIQSNEVTQSQGPAESNPSCANSTGIGRSNIDFKAQKKQQADFLNAYLNLNLNGEHATTTTAICETSSRLTQITESDAGSCIEVVSVSSISSISSAASSVN